MSHSRRHEWPLRMSRRVRFSGRLRMTSALHVGGGVGASSSTDAGVVRHADGRPYIPGSSLKGALRSHLERLCQTEALVSVGARSCLLYAPDEDGPAWSPSAPQCPTPGWVDEGKDVTEAGEEEFAALCPTCTLFGSPILAGKVRIPDLEVDEQTFGGQIEIRDGVGIDRDRGRAVDQVKFDYEAIPSGTGFEFSLTVDSPDVVELGLAAIAIREMQEGHLAVGGKTTRGMGHCVLSEVAIEDADFGSVNGMASYFQRRAEGETSEVADPDAYLDERIEDLFASA